jgi:hypothetical protein
MPVQHFAQPTTTTIDPKQPITEIRWDFGYTTIEILEAGQLIAQIRDPNVLLSSGVDITANNGHRFVLHVKKDVSAGPFAVFRNDIELVGGIPSWGVAPSVAGKLVHLPNDLYQEKLSIRKNLERPVRIAQSWLGFASLVSIVFAYLSGMGSRFVPPRFLSSVDTPLFTGAISALTFMALALAIQKRTAFFVLPIAQIFTIVQALSVGSDLLKGPDYPHFGGFRLFVSALSVWVLIDSWKTVRVHRSKAREARKQNRIGLDEIEKTTVRDLAKVADERGHLLAWQHTQSEASTAPRLGNVEPTTSAHSFPSALDLLPDGLDPFTPTAHPFTPTANPAPMSALVPPSASAPMRLAPPVLSPASAAGAPLPASVLVAPQGLTGSDAPTASESGSSTFAPAFAASPTPFRSPTSQSVSTLPQPAPIRQHVPEVPEPPAWVPPAAPLPEPTDGAKPIPSHHPLRSRVRSGL